MQHGVRAAVNLPIFSLFYLSSAFLSLVNGYRSSESDFFSFPPSFYFYLTKHVKGSSESDFFTFPPIFHFSLTKLVKGHRSSESDFIFTFLPIFHFSLTKLVKGYPAHAGSRRDLECAVSLRSDWMHVLEDLFLKDFSWCSEATSIEIKMPITKLFLVLIAHAVVCLFAFKLIIYLCQFQFVAVICIYVCRA